MSDIEQRVRAIFLRHVAADMLDRLAPEATYLQSLGLDSPALLNLVIDLEDGFGVEIASTELYRLNTLDDVVRALTPET